MQYSAILITKEHLLKLLARDIADTHLLVFTLSEPFRLRIAAASAFAMAVPASFVTAFYMKKAAVQMPDFKKILLPLPFFLTTAGGGMCLYIFMLKATIIKGMGLSVDPAGLFVSAIAAQGGLLYVSALRLVEMIATVWCLVLIIWYLKKQRPEIPEKLRDLLSIIALVKLFTSTMILLPVLFMWPHPAFITAFIGLIQAGGIYFVWIRYFRHSKRVKACYGKKPEDMQTAGIYPG